MDANWLRCCLHCQLLFRSEERRQSRHQRQLIKPCLTPYAETERRVSWWGLGASELQCVSGDHRMIDIHFRSNQRWQTGPKLEIMIFLSQLIRIFYVFSWFRAITDIETIRLLRRTCCYTCNYSFFSRILHLYSYIEKDIDENKTKTIVKNTRKAQIKNTENTQNMLANCSVGWKVWGRQLRGYLLYSKWSNHDNSDADCPILLKFSTMVH